MAANILSFLPERQRPSTQQLDARASVLFGILICAESAFSAPVRRDRNEKQPPHRSLRSANR
eukprot:scaffold1733_cov257-Pinguiococcus_pyrenoidosus.AAC.1